MLTFLPAAPSGASAARAVDAIAARSERTTATRAKGREKRVDFDMESPFSRRCGIRHEGNETGERGTDECFGWIRIGPHVSSSGPRDQAFSIGSSFLLTLGKG